MKSFRNRLKSLGLAIPMACMIAATLPMNAIAAEPVLDETEIGLEGALVFTNMAECNVYVNGAWSADLSDSYAYGDTVTAEAPETVSGKKFSYWEAEGSILSYDSKFTFTITANTKLEAVYGKTASKTSTAGFTSITKDDNGSIVFNAYSEADGATERGIYYSKTASTKDALISKGTKEQGTAEDKCCTLTVAPESETTEYYAMPYVKNSSSTFYGTVKKVCLEELDFGISSVLDLGDGTDTELPEDISEELDVPGVTDVLGTAEAPTVDSEGVVHWNAVKNAVKYKIVKEYNDKTFLGKETTETSYKQNYVPDIEYKVYIRSFDSEGNYTDGDVLTVPESDELGRAKVPTLDANGVVKWDAVRKATKYRVVKIINGKKYYGKVTTETSYKLAYKPRRDCQIYIVSYDDEKNFTKGKALKVSLPLEYVDDVKVDGNKITWTAAKNAVKYKIGKTANGKTFYSGDITDTTYTFKNTATRDYKVFIVAYDKDGNKTWGKKVSVKVK